MTTFLLKKKNKPQTFLCLTWRYVTIPFFLKLKKTDSFKLSC